MNLTSSKNWKTVKLGDLVFKVIDNRGKTPPVSESGFELLEVNAITEKSRFPEYQLVKKFVDQDIYNSWFRTGHIQKGDIIIPTVGTIGNVAISLENRGSVAQNLIALRFQKNNDPLFLYYILSAPKFKKQIFNLDIGGVQPSVKVPHLLDSEIIIPESIEEQKEIADILGSLDDKIELLRKENKTLESIAQTLFKEWFVDFNFPGATGKMIDSELGLIPEGWRVGKLGEFINVRGGLSYDGNLISKKGTPMLTMGFVSGNKRFEWSGLKFYTGKYKDQNMVEVGSLVIATRDVTQDRILIGSPALVPKILGSSDIIVATNLYITENISYLSNKFLYWLMRTPEYRERIVGACKGTTIVMITKDSIFDYEFAVPPKGIAEKFDHINDHIFNKLELIDIEIQTLSRLRDDLLNKIFSV
jgi:type I restriction enzyme S subunit